MSKCKDRLELFVQSFGAILFRASLTSFHIYYYLFAFFLRGGHNSLLSKCEG